MKFTPKTKASELSSIPWATRKRKSQKPKIPWATSKEKTQNPLSKINLTKLEYLAQGQAAETQALRLLELQGLTLLTRNHRCRCGELDLIMSQEETAVIVEVRLRNSSTHGNALESVSNQKQNRINQCAKLWWIKEGQHKFKHLRFDVIALKQGTEPVWVKNAWQIS
jgi:putative endonuclease